ncbi:MAG TPA: hypothetical protein VNP94_12630 [Actinomycetota bacterium]|nr:hypothetical protein [Actinomycetota bacterium]
MIEHAGPSSPEDRRLSRAIERVAAAVGIPWSAYLFGWRAEGRAHRESDLGLAILLPWDRPGGREHFELRTRC